MTLTNASAVPSALELARRYAARGWRPFPIPHGVKKPNEEWGVKVASPPTDAMLRLWFPEGRPLNVGIGVKFSGLFVLDEDTAGELERLCHDLGEELPQTYTVHTSAGRQLYYATDYDEDNAHVLRNRVDVGGYDIDTRGTGGQYGGFVVAAGSLHPSGVEYLAQDDAAAVAPLPAWVVDWLESVDANKAAPSPAAGAVPPLGNTPRPGAPGLGNMPGPQRVQNAPRVFTPAQAQAYVNDQCVAPLRAARPGTRNHTLNTSAMVLGHFLPAFWAEADGAEALLRVAGEIGLVAEDGEAQCRASIASGLRAGMAEPYTRVDPAPDAPPVDAEHDSWVPRSADRLRAVLEGRVERPSPSVGASRSDGARFLYPGLEHALIGEMEAGKSWWALAACAAELEAGNRVAYVHFEESDETGTVLRLAQEFRVPVERILADFLFIGPERPVDPGRVDLIVGDRPPTLVVLDGQNEAMALHSQGIYDADGAAEFRRQLVKPWTRHGAAVLSLDHVTKDPERNRQGYAFGSVHKGNGLNGALLVLENAEPFGEGRKGTSNVYVTKDRPGKLRALGKAAEKRSAARTTFIGRMTIDATTPGSWSWSFVPPAPEDGDDEAFAREKARGQEAKAEAAVLTALRAANARRTTPTKTDLAKGSGINYAEARDAISRLLVDGRIRNQSYGQGSALEVVDPDQDAGT